MTAAGKQLQAALKNLDGKVAKVGWFENSKYPDKKGTQVAQVAAIQEYGWPARNIPPRPFMRPTIIEKEKEWRNLAESGVKAILAGNETIGTVMEKIGLRAAGQVRAKITEILEPPLSPVTIYNRFHRKSDKKTIGLLTKPLVDTGILLGTCTNIVEDE